MERRRKGLPDAAKPTTWAVLRTGGKQYVVRTGDRLDVARSDYLAAAVHDADGRRFFAFDDVLMLGSVEGTIVGSPNVPNARVVAELLPERRGPKVVSLKKRRRQNSRRKRGHRQTLQPVLIVSVESGAAGSLGEAARSSAARPETAERGRLVGADLPTLLSELRWGETERVAAALREVAVRTWANVPDRDRREVARALEPLLTSADRPLRAGSTLALAVLVGVPSGAEASPEAVAAALTRHFARTQRRHFVEASLRVDARGNTGPDGLLRYQAMVSLRNRLDLPSGNATVRLGQGIPASSHVEVSVSGPGVDLGSRRLTLRGEKPEGILREAVVDFRNDPGVSDTAMLDVVVDGRRIERRFLALSRLGISREPPAPPTVAGSGPTATAPYDRGLTSMPKSPVQESASSA